MTAERPSGEQRGCPAELEPDALLTDPRSEVGRCAAQHWWARGIDLTGQPVPWILGWEQTREALTDPGLSSQSFPDNAIANGLSPRTAFQIAPLFSLHGDDHRHLRSVLSTAFTPRRVERLRPKARATAERLADGIESNGGSCEFVAAFAEPLPPEVFATLFGLPVEDRDRLAEWAETIGAGFALTMTPEQVVAVEQAAAEMRAYSHERITLARESPGDDLVTHLLEAEVDGRRLTDDEVIAMITGFVFAGAETTRRQLTAAMQVFADHPDQWNRLADEPDFVPNATEEVMRHSPIVPGLTRRVEDEYTLDDERIHAGETIVVSFDAANRDGGRFGDPSTFDVARSDASAHLTFGWGPHHCVGAGLARLEMTEALSVLVSRFEPPQIQRVGESTVLAAPDRLWLTLPSRR